jgi:uncharacterized membrane protein
MISKATFCLALATALTFGTAQAASAHGGHFGGGHFGGVGGHHFGFHHGPGFFFGGPYYYDAYDDYDNDNAACYKRVHIRHYGWRWVWICD